VCIQSTRSALTDFVLNKKLRRDSVKLPFAKGAKSMLQGVHSHPQVAKYCTRIRYKECTHYKFD
jgi:hypothetical protein